jgi:hypothetical protein
MSAADLLFELNRRGIRLEANSDRLRYHPQSALTPDLLALLKAHKAELLAILNANQQAEAAKHGDQPQADQAGHLETARRCLAQRLEALRLAGVQQLGRARPAAAADVPPVPADAATRAADSPAASIPAAADPRRPGAGEAPATAATTPDPPADPSAAGQAEAPAATPAAGQTTGQTDGQASGQAASADDLDAQRLWLAAMAELAGELPQDVLRGCLTAVVRYGGPGNPLCQPGTRQATCRCGSTAWKDVVLTHSPHNGRSVRRDCARCGRTLGLLRWYGGPGNLADDPPHRGELAAGS